MWYPTDGKENARLIISRIILDTFKALNMHYLESDAKRREELLFICPHWPGVTEWMCRDDGFLRGINATPHLLCWLTNGRLGSGPIVWVGATGGRG